MKNAFGKILVDETSQHFAPRGKRRGRPAMVRIDRAAFAERLSRAIRECRLSYLETARRAQKFLPDDATISDASVWSYAKGRTLPRRMEHVEALARVLGFSSREVIESDGLAGRGRVARPFGFALTDPGVRLSRTRLLLKVTRVMPGAASMVV